MPWLAIIQLVLKAVAGVVDYLGNRQLLEAGKAQALTEGLRTTLDNVEKANVVRAELSTNPDGDFAARLRDKYERPDDK